MRLSAGISPAIVYEDIIKCIDAVSDPEDLAYIFQTLQRVLQCAACLDGF